MRYLWVPAPVCEATAGAFAAASPVVAVPFACVLGAFRLAALSRFVAILLNQVMRCVHVVHADALLQARGRARLQAVDAHVGDFLLLI